MRIDCGVDHLRVSRSGHCVLLKEDLAAISAAASLRFTCNGTGGSDGGNSLRSVSHHGDAHYRFGVTGTGIFYVALLLTGGIDRLHRLENVAMARSEKLLAGRKPHYAQHRYQRDEKQ
jgi:hypothetical protein